MILGLFKISGHSMMPSFKPGTRVLVSSIPYSINKPKIGDVVVFRNSSKILIKRIAKINKDNFEVSGDNKNDSLNIGFVYKKDILGKVVIKI